MKLSEKQGVFILNVSKLIQFANDRGWWLTGGELLRTKEQQEIYFNEGKSKTMNSKHLSRLAIDLNLFVIVVSLDFHWSKLNKLYYCMVARNIHVNKLIKLPIPICMMLNQELNDCKKCERN